MRGIGKDLQAAFNLGYKARDMEIVRCKDCRWYDKVDWCNLLRISGIEEYWFCAEGERKDDEQIR